MKLNVRSISLNCTFLIASLVIASGCTKKVPVVNPDKIRGSALQEKLKEEAEEAAQAAAETDAGKLPEPSHDDSPSIARPIERTPTPGRVLTPKPVAEQLTATEEEKAPTLPVAETPKPPTAISKPVVSTPVTLFEKCAENKAVAIIGALEHVRAAGVKPSQLSATRKALFDFCTHDIQDKSIKAELEKTDLIPLIVDETLKRFPENEDAVKFFKAIEDKTTYPREQKEKIYAVYGSGGEIATTGVQFFGKLDASKSTSNVISYNVTSVLGSWSTRIFVKDGNIGKSQNTDLKSIAKPNIRFTFDFSPSEKNVYQLTISDGAAKVTANVSFKVGDLKTLRERKQVTVTLTSETWYKVQEAHLRNLIADQAKDLISMPFALDRKQKDMHLVRTCNLKEESIACTDPDYSISAIVKTSSAPAK